MFRSLFDIMKDILFFWMPISLFLMWTYWILLGCGNKRTSIKKYVQRYFILVIYKEFKLIKILFTTQEALCHSITIFLTEYILQCPIRMHRNWKENFQEVEHIEREKKMNQLPTWFLQFTFVIRITMNPGNPILSEHLQRQCARIIRPDICFWK